MRFAALNISDKPMKDASEETHSNPMELSDGQNMHRGKVPSRSTSPEDNIGSNSARTKSDKFIPFLNENPVPQFDSKYARSGRFRVDTIDKPQGRKPNSLSIVTSREVPRLDDVPLSEESTSTDSENEDGYLNCK